MKWLQLTLLFVFITLYTRTSQAQYNTEDVAALILLRDSTGGWNGTTTAGWNQGSNFPLPATALNEWKGVNYGNWFGVEWEFIGTEYRVVEINLDGANFRPIATEYLDGILPNSIFKKQNPSPVYTGRLAYVHTLNLSNNKIRDARQSFIESNMDSLNYFNISNNLMASHTDILLNLTQNFNELDTFLARNVFDTAVGSIDLNTITIPGSYSIRYVDLSANRFINTLNLDAILNASAWASVEILYLDDNRFSAIGVPTASSPVFTKLSIDNNQISNLGSIADFLGSGVTSGGTYPNLKYFMANNAMDTQGGHHSILWGGVLIPDIQNSLLWLDLSYNNLDGNLVLNNNSLRVENLLLNNNHIDTLNVTATTPNFILKKLDVNDNELEGEFPEYFFEKSNQIQEINAQNNYLDRLPEPIQVNTPYGGLMNLRILNFENNQFKGPLKLVNFANFTTSNVFPLRYFNFGNNSFDEVEVDPLIVGGTVAYTFNDLEQVTIDSNNLTFEDINNVAHFFKMKREFIPIGTGGLSLQDKSHYVPSNAPDIGVLGNRKDPYSFNYTNQKERGIGGVRRRYAGDSTDINVDMGAPIFPKLNSVTSVMNWSNHYEWEMLDTVLTVPVTTFLGDTYVDSLGSTGLISVVNDIVHYNIGIDTQRIDDMLLRNLDTMTHSNKNYRLKVTNRAFPLDTIYSPYKKVRIGGCVDSVGAPVHCQTIIVQFADTTSDATKEGIREEMGMTKIDSCLCGSVELWAMSDTMNVQEIDVEGNGTGTRIASNTVEQQQVALLSADPNYDVVTDTSTANNTTVANFPSNTSSKSDSATVLVAILDSGVDYDYVPLRNHLVYEGGDDCLTGVKYGYNFVDENTNADDDFGHGTAVAGIIAGLVDSPQELPDTNSYREEIAILPLKITNQAKEGTVFEAACAMHYAANYRKTTPQGDTARVRVINTSWGYYGEPCVTLENALRYVSEDCGILVVASAGNDGINVKPKADWHWPSNSIWNDPNTTDDDDFEDNVIGVGAMAHSSNTLYNYSNYSPKHIDLVAEGTYNTTQAGTNGGYASVNGTSFSSAAVSRAAALLFAAHPEASLYAVKYALKVGGDAIMSNWADSTAWGVRLNFDTALVVLDSMYKPDSCYNFVENGALSDPNQTVNVVELEEEKTGVQIARVYPNPFNSNLNIVLEQNIQETLVQLISVEGRTLYQQVLDRGESSLELSLEELPPGMYLLRLQQGKKQVTQKLIKTQ